MIEELIDKSCKQAVLAAEVLTLDSTKKFIASVAEMIAEGYSQGQKLLICGNGGSLCDAMHFAEELTGQFRAPRRALAAIALADPSHMSCVSNDMGFEEVFARGVEAFGKEEDVLVVLSTSGNSPNIVNALVKAKSMGLKTAAFLGKSGGAAKGLADLELIVEGFAYSDRIQEVHMSAIHIVIEAVEAILLKTDCLISELAHECR